PSPPARHFSHSAGASRPGSARVRDHSRRGGPHRRRAAHERRNALPLDRADGRAGTHHRGRQASRRRRRAAALLPADVAGQCCRARRGGATVGSRTARATTRADAGYDMRRLYRALLYLYPRRFREEYGEELWRAFEQSARNRSMLGKVGAAVSDVIPNAIAAHWDILRHGAEAGTTWPAFGSDIRFACRQIRTAPLLAGAVIGRLRLG